MDGDVRDADVKDVNPPHINMDKFRQLVRKYINEHQYQSALFWADKIVTLSNACPGDVYWYAHTMYFTGQYHRAINQLKNHELEKKYLACRYLIARCHYACKQWEEALQVLNMTPISQPVPNTPVPNTPVDNPIPTATPTAAGMPSENLESSMSLLRGKVYEAMDNRTLACESFREALQHDVYCYEAFENLVNHEMLSAQEETDLIEQLPFRKQCPEEEIQLLKFLYESKLKKYHRSNKLEVPKNLENLNENMDIMVSLAQSDYYNCDFQQCYKITSEVLDKDPYNSQCLPLHIAVLVELKKSNALFYLAHKLVDIYPSQPVSWYAVGCYYFLNGDNDYARRYLSKATTLDPVYGPAWLAFGHSFAVENEHDQAMAAYFNAGQLMKGCHLPMLYIGLGYGLTNNARLAECFFDQALTMAPDDPFVLHEMGVLAFENFDYTKAEKYFSSALEKVQVIIQEVEPRKWEPLVNNMGHTCRKLKKYDSALEFHQQSLLLRPQNPSTLSAIGYVYLLTAQFAKSVDYFHKALGLRRDDTFSTMMLGNAIEQLMGEMSPCDGVPDLLPLYTYTGRLDLTEQSDDAINPVWNSSKDTVTSQPFTARTIPLPAGTDSTADGSMLDSSSIAFDTDMEDA